MIGVLTWVGQCAALAVLTALFVRLPGCRGKAVTRVWAWSLALLLSAGLMLVPVLIAGEPATVSSGVGGALVAPAVGPIIPIAVSSGTARWLVLAAWVWAAGTLGWLVLVALDATRVSRLKRSARPFSPDELRRLGPWLGLLTRGRMPRVCWCEELDGPAVLGFADPVIALPRGQAGELTDEDLRYVVLHELAHVRRRDDWGVLAERMLVSLMWVNPAAHWMRRQLVIAREMACDDWVVRQTGSARGYAACLATLAELRSHTRALRMAAAMAGRQSALGGRVVRVLDLDRRPPSRLAGAAAILAPFGVGIVALGLLQLPPVFVLEQAAVEGPVPLAVKAPPAGVAVSRTAGPALLVGLAAPSGSPAQARQASPRFRASLAAPVAASRTTEKAPGEPVVESPMDASAAESDGRVLDARPLRGVGAAVLTAPGEPHDTALPQVGANTRWWEGPAAFGAATGSGAVRAGRATASFFNRIRS